MWFHRRVIDIDFGRLPARSPGWTALDARAAAWADCLQHFYLGLKPGVDRDARQTWQLRAFGRAIERDAPSPARKVAQKTDSSVSLRYGNFAA